MPDDRSSQAHPWPTPAFRFEVAWDDVVVRFQEVSGLDVEAQPIEYRHGDSRQFSVRRMPGLRKSSDVTLKKGIVARDTAAAAWLAPPPGGAIVRKRVIIRLIDEGGATAMSWELSNAWPTKVTGSTLKATGNEVAIETLVLAHEGLTAAGG